MQDQQFIKLIETGDSEWTSYDSRDSSQMVPAVNQRLTEYLTNCPVESMVDTEEMEPNEFQICRFVKRDGSMYIEFDRRYLIVGSQSPE